MDTRVLVLAIPSLAVLCLLVWHSLRALPRRRAAAFWGAVAIYGLLRGVAVALVTREGLGAALPYRIHNPLFAVFGVSLQEVAGWAIVAYLAWWLGERFSRGLFLQAAWGCLFLGAISWAVEAAAIAAGWWHWTVPVGLPALLGVPWIGLVDWFFVGTDFLLPFLVLTAPSLSGRRRYLTLLLFPLHMAAHLLPGPGLDAAHWLLLGMVLWLALRSKTEDAAFSGGIRWPLAALGIVLADLALVDLFLAKDPRLLASLLPAIGVAVQALWPAVGPAVLIASALGAFAFAPLGAGTIPPLAAGPLRSGRRVRWMAPAVLAVLAVAALAVQATDRRGEEDLKRRLDHALAARDRGDLGTAEGELAAISRDHPGSHVPLALLGEIQYRAGHPDGARSSYEKAVAIKRDFVEGYRYLAVIHLQAGRRHAAKEAAARGLAVAPDDLELRYLGGAGIADLWPDIAARGPAAANAIGGLAYEVGDVNGSLETIDRALARWPEERRLREIREQLIRAGAAPPAPPGSPGRCL
jgi:tetratricopeptide (TPR) repeat protein